MVEETAEERADLEAILAEAARADRLLPLIQGAEQRTEAAAKARQLAADAVARALPLLAGGRDPSPDLLATLERDRRSEITRLGELRAEESRLVKIVQEREQAGREIARADRRAGRGRRPPGGPPRPPARRGRPPHGRPPRRRPRPRRRVGGGERRRPAPGGRAP